MYVFFDFPYISLYVLHRVFYAFYTGKNVRGAVRVASEINGAERYFAVYDMKGIGRECACFRFNGHVVEIKSLALIMESAADFPERN